MIGLVYGFVYIFAFKILKNSKFFLFPVKFIPLLTTMPNLNTMNYITKTLFALSMVFVAVACCGEDVSAPKVEEPLTQIPFQYVELEDHFWLPRLKVQKEVLVPFSFEKTEYAVENLRRVGAYLRGERVTKPLEGRYYVASDLFKVMEGAAYELVKTNS